MNRRRGFRALLRLKGLTFAVGAACAISPAYAFKFDSSSDWSINLDTTVQYTAGWRVQERDNGIGNHVFNAAGDYKFDKGDMVTNRVQALVEFQAVKQQNTGFRLSGSVWNDFAYDDKVRTNPNPAFSALVTYPDGKYTNDTKRFHLQGGELLDAFVFHNTDAGDVPVYLRAGRFTQFWGNAFFFGFSNIAYSQHPVDFIKGFSQPGSEVKELFLPRTQVMASAELSPELSVSAQYFFEYAANRYPEGATYLAPADFLYKGPRTVPALAGVLGGPVSAGVEHKPPHNNDNFGVRLGWSPAWAEGNMAFYYRQFDEVHPWPSADIGASGGGEVHLIYPRKAKLFGVSYERNIGPLSAGFELSYRKDSGLNSAFTNGQPGVPYREGATGSLVNVIANGLVPLPETAIWDAATLIGEFSYTHLVDVTGKKSLYNGEGRAACADSITQIPGSGSKADGCATRNALAFAMLFEPQWFQVWPGIDLSAPMSLTYGISGVPAYSAGSFYAEGAALYSIGLKALIHSKHTLSIAYNGYHYETRPKVNIPGLGESYSGGSGAFALNDKGWIQLQFKTSF